MMVQGTTVEITRVFTDFDGVAYDPTEIELKLFDLQKQQINETISVTAAYKCDVGVYKVPVVLPEGDEYTMIVYEFSGKDANGNPDVLRKAIRTPWAE